MKPVRWTAHALHNLDDREVDLEEARQTIDNPDYATPDPPRREIRMRLYFDTLLQQKMLLRVVIEETEDELTVVTLYKTSQIKRYLRGQQP